MDNLFSKLETEVAHDPDVKSGVKNLLDGLKKCLADAIADALAKGANQESVANFTTLDTALSASCDGLAAAVVANTPVAHPAHGAHAPAHPALKPKGK